MSTHHTLGGLRAAVCAALCIVVLATSCGSDSAGTTEDSSDSAAQPTAQTETATPTPLPTTPPVDQAEATPDTTADEEPAATTEEGTDDSTVDGDAEPEDATSDEAEAPSVLTTAVAAAETLTGTLTDAQMSTLSYDYGDASIVDLWSNLPACDRGRPGIRHGDLDEAQLDAVYAVVDAVLSDEGSLEYRQIIAADEELGGGNGDVWDADCYYLAIYGTPSAIDPWAFMFGGHHYARIVDFSGGQIAVTPAFTGVEPRSFELDGETIEPLGEEAIAIFAVLAALDDSQLADAELAGSYTHVQLGPGSDAFPETEGLSLGDASDEVRQLAVAAAAAWTNDFEAEIAEPVIASITANLDDTYIGWSTSTDIDTQGAYVRIDGPSAWIEFSNEGGVGGNDIHQHSVYRDKLLDYGTAG